MNKFQTFMRDLYKRTVAAIQRFPVSMTVIVLAFGLMVYTTWVNYYYWPESIHRLIGILWIVLPLFTAPTLFFKQRWTLIPGLLAGLILWFTTHDGLPDQDMALLTMWGVAFYSLIFILPRWRRNENNGFWKYCEEILFILILGFICSGILAISLELAVESIRQLFNVNIDYRWNETLLLFSFFFVLPIFVHVGLPAEWEALENRRDYPGFFKAISFYLLTPIALLYFGILGVYLGKILITQIWPSGQVAYPIVFLSMVVFALYLVSYPWRQNWQRWFFFALMPFIVVYFVALGMRIDQYGLTEARYMGLLLGVCLAFMTLYFAFVKRQRLQMMLLPVAGVAFLFAWGPWGVIELPIRSQEARLESLLTEIGALQDGKLQWVDAEMVDEETETQISSIVDYLYWRDRLDDLQTWSSSDLSDDSYDLEYDFMAEIGLEFNPYGYWDYYGPGGNSFYFGSIYGQPLEVSGFDSIVRVDLSIDQYYSDDTRYFSFMGDRELSVSLNDAGVITVDDGTTQVQLSAYGLYQSLSADGTQDQSGYSPAELMLEAESNTMNVRFYFESLNGNYTDDGEITYMYLNGSLLVDFKR